MTANQLATAATQPAVPSISPGAQTIQPSSLRVPQASFYHASAITNSPVGTGRPDVKINLWSFGPPRKPFDHRRLGNQPPQHCNSIRNRGRGYGGRGGAYGRSYGRGGGRAAMALDGAVDVALDVAVDAAVDVAVDVIVTDNGDTAPGNYGGGWPRKATRTSTRRARRITLPSVQPGLEGELKSAKKTLATDSKNPTTQMDQLEHQTGNDGASRTWKWTSENLDEGGKNAPSFLVW
ncbi:LOW QUALITY PROTEIN: hypothetical protein RvY_09562 [Ramazzottius varieornatus]|uniref:Uncharacterized protein n=1 Tax=Ramazzottius varieornatus TaxID=947166 RepID=A0A1D1VBY8_RAMVA|nr:LOW QUALITY PROTEIN: hypothetical protein RvY_09562 [Ramazzottius varieornatus]